MNFMDPSNLNSARSVSDNFREKEKQKELEHLKNQKIDEIAFNTKKQNDELIKQNDMLKKQIENFKQSSKKQKIYNWFTTAIALVSIIIAIIGLCK